MDGVSPELRIAISLERFSGRWYETARTRGIPFEPRGTTDVTATYSWDGRTFGIHNEALLNGQPISWRTKVKRIDNAFNTRFIIEVPPPPGTNLPAGEGVYRILMLDTDEYKWAVVASGERDGWVWVLSREQLMTQDRWRNIFDRLEREFGYDPRRLEYTVHTHQPALLSPPELPDFKVFLFCEPKVQQPSQWAVYWPRPPLAAQPGPHSPPLPESQAPRGRPDFKVPEVENPRWFVAPLGDNAFRVTFGRK